jgi:hypothetical protein
MPKNGLVLTSINKSGKYTFLLEEIDEYSLFDVDSLPVVYRGVLTDKMVEAIKYFINTSEEDLEYIFGEVIYFFLL